MRTLSRSLLALIPIAAAAALAACGDSGSSADTTGTTSTTGGGGDTAGGTGGSGGEEPPPPPPPMRKTITGDVSWNVTFDETAKAAGATDCVYTRHYVGVEDASAPWFCPSCEVMFRADVTMPVGADDCFKQISDTAPAKVEWIGYANGSWWRGSGGPMTEQGTATVDQQNVKTTNTVKDLDVPAGGKMEFGVEGSLTLGEEEGDRFNGWVPPATYACGWPKADPPAYTGDYTIAKGQTVPDGLFRDKCDEVVRLHDFKGSYLVIDMSAMDCPPCQSMASKEEAFIENMKAQGITVHMITLLAPSLSNTLGETSKAKLETWTKKYSLTSPVLGDRGWGVSMFLPIFQDQLGYPSWVIVDPELNVLDTGNGFGDYSDFEKVIAADAQ